MCYPVQAALQQVGNVTQQPTNGSYTLHHWPLHSHRLRYCSVLLGTCSMKQKQAKVGAVVDRGHDRRGSIAADGWFFLSATHMLC